MKTALIIIAGLILAFFAFSAVKPSKKEKQQAVYYYPQANVYHDLSENEYYFYHSEQKEWFATKKISSEQEASLGKKVSVGMVKPAWKNNYQDRMIHSVSLYGSAGILKQKYQEDSLKLFQRNDPIAASSSASVQENNPPAPEKPKKGLKKFFDRLFGKKDQG
jgi:hypothetical protein